MGWEQGADRRPIGRGRPRLRSSVGIVVENGVVDAVVDATAVVDANVVVDLDESVDVDEFAASLP